MAYEVLPFKGLNLQINVLIIQRTTCLLTLSYAVKTGRPRFHLYKIFSKNGYKVTKPIILRIPIGIFFDYRTINNNLCKKFKKSENEKTISFVDGRSFISVRFLPARKHCRGVYSGTSGFHRK